MMSSCLRLCCYILAGLLLSAAVSSILYFIAFPLTIHTQVNQTNTGFLFHMGPIPGQEVSLDQAQASVSFKINLPTNIGTFVELKLSQPPQTLPGQETLFVIYATSKPSNNATIDDVVNQNGIIFGEWASGMTLQEGYQNILAAIDSTKNDSGGGLQLVNINRYVGCAGGNLDVHEVSWYTETTECHLIANINYPLQQLVEIAQSIPVN
jgi:hypothetical protein